MPPVGNRGFGSCYDDAAQIELESENVAISSSESTSEASSDNEVDNEINVNIVVNTDDNNTDSESGDTVEICHNGETLEIPVEALSAHLGHGDTLGPCEEIDTTSANDEGVEERLSPESEKPESSKSTESTK